jgi:exodeoxyribonuclease VII large subunit
MPIFLDCPYSEKDEAKKLGAKFDWAEKKWFIPPGLETEPFAKWLPQTHSEPLDKPDENSFTLNELLLSVQKTIAEKHATRYWVRAEIVNLSKNVHLYLDLVDYDNQGQEIAKIRATLWQSRAEALLKRFLEATNMPFKAGLKVLLQVRVEFHTRFGLSLDVLDIDPNFTLGELEAKLNRIRTQLKKEGIYLQNQQFAKVSEFCKVAVIAPPQAAGLGDFKSQADILAACGLCEFHYYTTAFQGQNRMTEMPAAFKKVHEAHNRQAYDAVVMIRGGGGKADLFQLNEYEIVKAVCTAQLPVIVGIGHERDQTLLDEVAHLTCHTPSLVITHIAGTIIDNARNAKQNWQNIAKLAGEKLTQAKVNNERLMTLMREQVARRIAEQRNQLSLLMQTIRSASQTQLNQAHHQIKLLMEQVLLGDPKRILKRGYAIVRNREHKIMTRKAVAQKETSLIIEFQDGQINCGQPQGIAPTNPD